MSSICLVPRNTVLQGDVLEKLKELPNNCIDVVVTSPPYWGLRDYGDPNQKKHRKLALIILIPALIFTFTIGWSLHYIGLTRTKTAKGTTQKKRKQN